MNCFNHPSEPAVTQCIDCGKGLCYDCATQYTSPICEECNNKRGKADIMKFVKPIVWSIVLFIVGYNLEIMGPDNAFGGYMFMSVYTGWKFISQFMPNLFILFNLRVLFWYYLIRIAVSMIIGAFTAPFYLVWCIYKLIRTILK